MKPGAVAEKFKIFTLMCELYSICNSDFGVDTPLVLVPK